MVECLVVAKAGMMVVAMVVRWAEQWAHRKVEYSVALLEHLWVAQLVVSKVVLKVGR